MTQSINLNQFGIEDVNARILNPDKAFRYECKANAAIVAGQAVKLVNAAGASVPVVTPVIATTDIPFGIVPYEPAKTNAYAQNDMVTVAGDYSIVKIVASEAITAGQAVAYDVTNGKAVIVADEGDAILGHALTTVAKDAFCKVLVKVGEIVPTSST